MSDIDKLEQHCVAGGTSVGSSPGQSLGPTSTSQTRVTLPLAQLLHTVKLSTED